MTAETDIAALTDGGENTAAEVRTALSSVLERASSGGKWATYVPTGSVGDDFADGSIDGWTAVGPNASAAVSWAEDYGALMLGKEVGTSWGAYDLAMQMRALAVGVGDWIEGAVSYRMAYTSPAYGGFALVMADGNTFGAGNQLTLWGYQTASINIGYQCEMANYTNFSTLGTRHGEQTLIPWPTHPLYLRLERSGTSEYKYYWSPNGQYWRLIDTATVTLVPTHVGLGMVNFNAGTAVPVYVDWHYFESSS